MRDTALNICPFLNGECVLSLYLAATTGPGVTFDCSCLGGGVCARALIKGDE